MSSGICAPSTRSSVVVEKFAEDKAPLLKLGNLADVKVFDGRQWRSTSDVGPPVTERVKKRKVASDDIFPLWDLEKQNTSCEGRIGHERKRRHIDNGTVAIIFPGNTNSLQNTM